MPFVNIDPVPGTGLDFTHAAEFHSHFQKAKQQMQDVQWNVMQRKIVNLIQKSCSQGRTAWLRRRRGSGVETQTRERRATIFLSFTNSYYAGTQDPLSSLWGQTSSRRSGGYTGVPESLQSSRGKELKPISFSLPLEEQKEEVLLILLNYCQRAVIGVGPLWPEPPAASHCGVGCIAQAFRQRAGRTEVKVWADKVLMSTYKGKRVI